MALLKILIFPDQRLRTVAKDVLDINEEIKTLCNDLLETTKPYIRNTVHLNLSTEVKAKYLVG